MIWIFFPPYFSQICQGSVNLAYFFEEPGFCFIACSYGFFGLYFINFGPYFYYFSPVWVFLVPVFLGV
jgi:hypothetical protein